MPDYNIKISLKGQADFKDLYNKLEKLRKSIITTFSSISTGKITPQTKELISSLQERIPRLRREFGRLVPKGDVFGLQKQFATYVPETLQKNLKKIVSEANRIFQSVGEKPIKLPVKIDRKIALEALEEIQKRLKEVPVKFKFGENFVKVSRQLQGLTASSKASIQDILNIELKRKQLIKEITKLYKELGIDITKNESVYSQLQKGNITNLNKQVQVISNLVKISKQNPKVWEKVKNQVQSVAKVIAENPDKIKRMISLTKTEEQISDRIAQKKRAQLQEEVSRRKMIAGIREMLNQLGYREVDINKIVASSQKLSSQELKKQHTLIERLLTISKAEPELWRRIYKEIEKSNHSLLKQPQLLGRTIKVLSAQYGHAYRTRLEWDRIGNSMRYFSFMVLSSIGYATRETTRWLTELLKMKGALQLTGKEAYGLSYLAGILGVDMVFLSKTTNNVYQALINAGQGTSFIAERVREALHSVGLSANKLNEDMGKSPEVFFKVIGALQSLEQRYGRAWVMQKVLGSSAEELGMALDIPADKLREMYEKGQRIFEQLGMPFEKIKESVIKVNETFTTMSIIFKTKLSAVLPGIAKGFNLIINFIVGLLKVLQKLPTGFVNATASVFIFSNAITYGLGSLLRLRTTLMRTLNLIKGRLIPLIQDKLIPLLKTFFTAIQAHPLIAALTLIATTAGVLVFKIQRYRSQLKKLTLENINSAKEMRKELEETGKSAEEYLRYIKMYGTSKEIERANSQYKKFLSFQDRARQYEEEINLKKQRGEKISVELASNYNAMTKLAKIQFDTLRKINDQVRLRVEKSYATTKDIEKAENLIKEENLDLYEQYKIWTDLLSRVKENSREQEKIKKKIASVLGEARSQVAKLIEELEKVGKEFPSWLKPIEDIDEKFREAEASLKTLLATGKAEDKARVEAFMNSYFGGASRVWKEGLNAIKKERIKIEEEVLEDKLEKILLRKKN